MKFSKFVLLTTTSFFACSGLVYAADQSADQNVEEIIVTGSRIERAGYEAPTPVTMQNRDEIQASASPQLADYLAKLPSFGIGVSSNNTNHAMNGGQAGINLVNLRNLGITRTLVLFDGHRVNASTLVGGVDMNLIPDSVVQRVDVVTGGASAAWGSDAVAGVVNIITNKEYNGVEVRVEAGIGNYGTNFTHKEEITGGTAFSGGKGHTVASFTYTDTPEYTYPNQLPWFVSQCLFPNTAGTTPTYVPVNNCYPSANFTKGGLITSGPLKNTQFLPGGVPAPYVIDRTFGNSVVGKDADQVWIGYQSLNGPTKHYNVYSHTSYEFSDDLGATLELNYSDVHSRFQTTNYTRTNQLITADNAYLPQTIKTAMAANGVTSFLMSRVMLDLDDGREQFASGAPGFGRVQSHVTRELYRGILSFNGKIFSDWKWEAYFTHGAAHNLNRAFTNPYVPNVTAAIDAVVNPATGQIVCRSSLPGAAQVANASAGCVPMNIFGFGSPSKASIDYVTNSYTGVQTIDTTQDVGAASLTGSPFSVPAGPVDIAVGAEWRRETAAATADAQSTARLFFSGNYSPLPKVGVTVKEGFAEVNVPLFKDVSFARSFDFNSAIRVTDYSTSGTVETWKAGISWSVVDEVRLRATRSRDIRAPTMSELYTPGLLSTINQGDPSKGNKNEQFIQNFAGNSTLRPEIGTTWTGGGVYSPGWMQGLQLSVDYFSIDLSGAVYQPSATQVIQQCFNGNVPAYCPLIERNGAQLPGETIKDISFVSLIPVNAAVATTRGIDVETSYSTDIGPGQAAFRVIGTYTFENSTTVNGVYSQDAGSVTANTPDGIAGLPKLRINANARYTWDPITIGLEANFIGPAKLNTYWTEGVQVADNSVPPIVYLTLNTSYDFEAFGSTAHLYLSISNLLDQAPPIVPSLPGGGARIGGLYDEYGRTFRGGIRAKF